MEEGELVKYFKGDNHQKMREKPNEKTEMCDFHDLFQF